MHLNKLYGVPENFFNIEIEEIQSVFSGPTLIHLKGKNPEPLFLSGLLHGNETTSFYVLQRFLSELDLDNLERDIIVFLGNVDAAAQKKRMLVDQPDFNRIWSEYDSPEGQLALEVIEYAKEYKLFASIDIHNNTGNNPYYACINKLGPQFLNLARQFAPYIVYFTEPHEVQSMAFAQFSTSVTLECGTPGKAEGIDYVTEFLHRIYKIDEISNLPIDISTLKVFQTRARLILKPNIKIDYKYEINGKADISLRTDIDDFNFQIVKTQECIGHTKESKNIRVIRNDNVDITDDILDFDNGKIILKTDIIPSMLTTNANIAVSDCLGYLMVNNPYKL